MLRPQAAGRGSQTSNMKLWFPRGQSGDSYSGKGIAYQNILGKGLYIRIYTYLK